MTASPTQDTALALADLPHDEAVSDNDIVPASLQNLLIAVSDQTKHSYFAIGDSAALLLKEAEAQGFRVKRVSGRDVFISQDRLFQAIGHFCDKSARTVRYYYETACFFPQDVREEFGELRFSFFVVARSFGSRWREVLEWASANPHADSETVKRVFLQGTAAGDAERVPTHQAFAEGEIAPDRATDVVGGLSRLLESASGFFKQIRLSPNLRKRSTLVLADFRFLLEEVAQELREQQNDGQAED